MAGEKGVLYVGGDDSNHAGDSKGEIIVATYSFDISDSRVKNFPNVRNWQKTRRWLESPDRDFGFAVLTLDQYRHSGDNLIRILPFLIEAYILEECQDLKRLNIYLDGRLRKDSRRKFREHFLGRHGIENVVVDNFIKKSRNRKGHIEKHPRCPSLVYHADVLAHELYRGKSFEELSKHKKLVLIN